MTIAELKQAITNKSLGNLYVLYGEEYTILEIYIKKILDALEEKYCSANSVFDIYKNLSAKSLINTGKVYVIRDDKDFLTNEPLWKNIEQKLKQRGITLILKYSTVDGRSKFYKQFEHCCISFDKLSDSVIDKYIKKDLDVPQDYVEYLRCVCKNDYGRVLLEINKVKNCANYYNLSEKDAFKMCANSHTFYMEPEGEIFELVDAIMTRNVKLVFECLSNSKRREDNSMALLSMLHNNVKAVLQLQIIGSDTKNISDATGLTGFQIKNAYKYVNRYSCDELIKFLKYIHYCEKSIKNGGIMQEIIIDYLLINIL